MASAVSAADADGAAGAGAGGGGRGGGGRGGGGWRSGDRCRGGWGGLVSRPIRLLVGELLDHQRIPELGWLRDRVEHVGTGVTRHRHHHEVSVAQLPPQDADVELDVAHGRKERLRGAPLDEAFVAEHAQGGDREGRGPPGEDCIGDGDDPGDDQADLDQAQEVADRAEQAVPLVGADPAHEQGEDQEADPGERIPHRREPVLLRFEDDRLVGDQVVAGVHLAPGLEWWIALGWGPPRPARVASPEAAARVRC